MSYNGFEAPVVLYPVHEHLLETDILLRGLLG